jgi:short-subunit dehydrogenase
MILITGKSDLATAIANKLTDCIIVGRPEYDFSKKEDCDKLLRDFPKPDVVINTFGVITDDCWTSITVNYLSPLYITSQYYNLLNKGHIINISSASSWWPTYPGIEDERLYYGIAKRSLSEFGQQFNRAKVDDLTDVCVTTIEPGKFISKMSKNQGIDIDKVVSTIEYVILTRAHHVSLIK